MRLPPSRGGRDFFPLPRVAAQVNEERGCWRRRDRAARRMRASTRRINDLVDSLNWMQGFKDSEGYGHVLYPLEKNVGTLLVDPMSFEVLARLDGAVQRTRDAAPLSPQTALRLLLRGRSPYDTRPGAVSLAPFRHELLSLPADVHECPHIEDLLPPEALAYLKGYQERMLASDDAEPKVKEFLDPSLRFNQKKYQSLIRDLFEKGLVAPLKEVKETVGLFAVWKVKGKSQRLIVDARRANARFRTPPGVDLMSSESMARMEVEFTEEQLGSRAAYCAAVEEARLYVGTADVKDCFHRMRIPGWLSEFFALPPVPAKTLGLQGSWLHGRLLDASSPVTPGWAVLPMGFSWSLYFAQVANASLAAIPLGPGAHEGLHDR